MTEFIPEISAFQEPEFNCFSQSSTTTTDALQFTHQSTDDLSSGNDLQQQQHVPPSSSVCPLSQPPSIALRRSTRSHQPPQYFRDFFCGMVHSEALPSEHHALVSTMGQYTEPSSYEEASKDRCWIQAMDKEIGALMDNQT